MQQVEEYFKRMEVKDGNILILPSTEKMVQIEEKTVILKACSPED